jgi:hypothetical protein
MILSVSANLKEIKERARKAGNARKVRNDFNAPNGLNDPNGFYDFNDLPNGVHRSGLDTPSRQR